MNKHGKSILVVDDHAMSVKLIEQILLADGFDVFSAGSGEEAITLVREFKPDLVLLDILLTGINGYKTLQVMQMITPAIPIIFLSSVADADKGMQLGAVDYIVKPFQMQDVISRVRKHLHLEPLA
jgi:DNA-binding response OmpR family regulator